MKRNLIITVIVIALLALAGGFYYYFKIKKEIPSAQVAMPSIAVNPSSGTFTVGQTVNIDIVVSSAGQVVSGVDVRFLRYQPQDLEVQGITAGSIFDSYLGQQIDTNLGTIALSGIVAVSSPQRAVEGIFATVGFKVLRAGTTTLSFDAGWINGRQDTTDTNISQIDPNTGIARDILETVTNGSYTLQNPQPNAPTADLKVNGKDSETISSGSSVELSWNSTNATSCSSSWGDAKNTSGQETINNVTSSKSFTLICQGGGGSISDSVSVTVQTSSGGGAVSPPEESSTNPSVTATTETTQTPSTLSTPETMTSPVNTPQISELPSNIQPEATPTKKQTTIYKNEAMKPWTLWFLYAIIPAFLAGGAIFIFLKRKKVAKKDEII